MNSVCKIVRIGNVSSHIFVMLGNTALPRLLKVTPPFINC